LLRTYHASGRKGNFVVNSYRFLLKIRLNHHFHERLLKAVIEPLICHVVKNLCLRRIIDGKAFNHFRYPAGKIRLGSLLEFAAKKSAPLLRSSPSAPTPRKHLCGTCFISVLLSNGRKDWENNIPFGVKPLVLIRFHRSAVAIVSLTR
jgi:hypothetical protein